MSVATADLASPSPPLDMGLEDIPLSYVFGRLVNLRPKIWKAGDKLFARSDWKSQVWNLGCAGRKLEIDPIQKVARISVRRFWFFTTSRRIEFDWVAELAYRYAEVSPGWGAYQQADLYTVELRLKNGDHVMLFRFFEEGDFVNNTVWPDWMYWGDALAATYGKGDQERESVLFADLVSRMIGVPVVNE